MQTVLRHNSLFRRIGWLAVWAMLLPVLLPLLHNPAANPVLAAWMQAAHCRGTLTASNSDKSSPQKTPLKNPSCPICQTAQMQHGGYVPPAPVALPAPTNINGITLPSVMSASLGAVIANAAWPRAPPTRA